MKSRIYLLFARNAVSEICDYEIETSKFLSKKDLVCAVFVNDPCSYSDLLMGKKMVVRKKASLFYVRPFNIFPLRLFSTAQLLNLYINIFIISSVLLFIKMGRKLGPMYMWMFHPNDYDLYRYVRFLFISVYDVVDYQAATEFFESKKLFNGHEHLVQNVHLVSTVSIQVYKKIKKIRTDVILAPLGFRIQSFRKKTVKVPRHVQLLIPKKYSRPYVGFVGGINHRIDFQLMLEVAKQCQRVNFIFIGPFQFEQDRNMRLLRSTDEWVSQLSQCKNVFFNTQTVDSKYMPSIIRSFDICMIPYDTGQEFNIYSNPMKLYEYFYCGKPVIATPLPALTVHSPYISIVSTPSEWRFAIEHLLLKRWPRRLQRAQQVLATENSWENKITEIIRHLPQ